MWERVCRNPHKPDDHRHRSAQDRDGDGRDRAPTRIRPKSDLALFYGLAHLLIAATAGSIATFIDAHTTGFDAFARARRGRSPLERVGRGDRPRRRGRSSRLAAHDPRGKRVSFWWTMGVNQSHEGVRTAQAIINLALMTGNIGRPGTGANSITGQCNAMGSRLFSNTTNLLGGHDFTRRRAPRQGRRHPRHPRRAHPGARTAWPTTRSSRRSCAGKIHGLWVIATNPAHSWINQDDAARRSSAGSTSWSCRTCTRRPRRRSCADLVLPAAGWGEKEGTFINSERRIGLDQEGRARARAGARRLPHLPADRRGLGLRRDVPRVDVARGGVPDPEASCRRGQPCDITGIARLRHARRARAASSGRSPRARTATPARASGGCSRTARFFHADGKARASSSRRRGRCPSRPTRRYPVHAAHRARQLEPVAHPDAHRQVGGAAQARTRASSTSRSAPSTRARSASRPTNWVVGGLAARRRSRRARSSRTPCSRARSSCRCTTPRSTS